MRSALEGRAERRGGGKGAEAPKKKNGEVGAGWRGEAGGRAVGVGERRGAGRGRAVPRRG